MARAKQRTLFDTEEPSAALVANRFARVVFNRPLRTMFSYAIPEPLAEKLVAGQRVLAPFGRGNHRTLGYCVGVTNEAPSGPIKPLVAVLDESPIVSPVLLALTEWLSEYYFCGWGQVLEAVLPAGVKREKGLRFAMLYVAVPEAERPKVDLPVKQQRAVDAMAQLGRPASMQEICDAARCGQGCLRELRKKGFLRVVRRPVLPKAPRVEPVLWDKPFTLNPSQKGACDAIIAALRETSARTFLLHGVTGSGKTEVYLQAIAEAHRLGKQAIVLVPEISLTPQTIRRFRQRFGDVAVLHSHLTDVERHWHWRRIAAGEVAVVVGARSAIFAPCPRLGLIVIDEEHETTFKQETTPRYHARRVAIERGRLEEAVVVLGSATPSLESFHAARKGPYQLLSLPERVMDLVLPKVELIDLRGEYRTGRRGSALSRPLVEGMRRALDPGGQVLLLLNRRGFSTSIVCPQCGQAVKCQHCDIALTYHKDLDRLLCHFCDAEFPVPAQCAKCGAAQIRYAGVGTERVHEEVRARFPGHRCERMDSDTMRSARHYDEVLSAFHKGEIQILLGTQMIAKGLDFPNVRLVGVINADTARGLPDFRASERTFQLLAQVAGRTGRGRDEGRVLVQTYCPEDRAIQAAAGHDYLRFAADELPVRRDFGYPPFAYLTRIIVRSPSETVARQAAQLVADRLRQHVASGEEVRLLGPAPAPIVRIKDFFRMHLQIHTASEAARSPLLDAALSDVTLPGDAEMAVDVDPMSLL